MLATRKTSKKTKKIIFIKEETRKRARAIKFKTRKTKAILFRIEFR